MSTDTRHVPWDPSQYLRFADERLRPAVDLMARVDPENAAEVYDLGCGAGNVTRLLRDRWPGARVTGVDSSAEMLERAAREDPTIEWVRADLATWRPARRADVLFSNAALHWLGGHERLFPELFAALAPGGVLAVQIPHNFDAPSFAAIAEVARSGPWHTRLGSLLRTTSVREPGFYYDLLAPHGASVDVWETEYLQVLTGDDPITEWHKGAALRPFLDALDEPDRGEFETRYAALVRKAYPRRPDGKTLFPFRRLFIVAKR